MTTVAQVREIARQYRGSVEEHRTHLKVVLFPEHGTRGALRATLPTAEEAQRYCLAVQVCLQMPPVWTASVEALASGSASVTPGPRALSDWIRGYQQAHADCLASLAAGQILEPPDFTLAQLEDGHAAGAQAYHSRLECAAAALLRSPYAA